MKNVIITCCNAKYGDSLVNNWLKSLKENVNLSNVDLVVIDIMNSCCHEKCETPEWNISFSKIRERRFTLSRLGHLPQKNTMISKKNIPHARYVMVT